MSSQEEFKGRQGEYVGGERKSSGREGSGGGHKSRGELSIKVHQNLKLALLGRRRLFAH